MNLERLNYYFCHVYIFFCYVRYVLLISFFYQNSNCTFTYDHPNSNIITTTYHENNKKTHSRKYIIHSLGVYPSNIKKTKKSSKNCPEYEIPDNYKVETTLEGYDVICETNYLSNGSVKFVLNWKDTQGID